MLPRFGGHPNTTEGGGHVHVEPTQAYAPEATSYVVIVPVLMIVIPPIHRFAMGQAGLPARYCIAPIRLFNVT